MDVFQIFTVFPYPSCWPHTHVYIHVCNSFFLLLLPYTCTNCAQCAVYSQKVDKWHAKLFRCPCPGELLKWLQLCDAWGQLVSWVAGWLIFPFRKFLIDHITDICQECSKSLQQSRIQLEFYFILVAWIIIEFLKNIFYKHYIDNSKMAKNLFKKINFNQAESYDIQNILYIKMAFLHTIFWEQDFVMVWILLSVSFLHPSFNNTNRNI